MRLCSVSVSPVGSETTVRSSSSSLGIRGLRFTLSNLGAWLHTTREDHATATSRFCHLTVHDMASGEPDCGSRRGDERSVGYQSGDRAWLPLYRATAMPAAVREPSSWCWPCRPPQPCDARPRR